VKAAKPLFLGSIPIADFNPNLSKRFDACCALHSERITPPAALFDGKPVERVVRFGCCVQKLLLLFLARALLPITGWPQDLTQCVTPVDDRRDLSGMDSFCDFCPFLWPLLGFLS
jgi:hypothetical protein